LAAITSDGRQPPIVLVHGLWLTPLSWEFWKERFEGRGHRVLAPAWPRMEGDPEAIRRDPSPLNGLGVKEITDHYAGIVEGLDRPPIVIGHSFGGLVTEQLLDRGLGAAGVALSPAPVKGVLRLPLAQLRAGFPVLGNPANRKRTVELTPKQFTTPSRTRWTTTSPSAPTSATRCRDLVARSSRRPPPSSIPMPQRRSTSTRTTARRCS
jgi:pimeloyl-ACP methyl ester carboxylesterase